MKLRWLFVTVLLASVGSSVMAEPCAYKLRADRPAGPEVTGNYARPYLYSPDTRCWYPDPMYYVAKDALRRWHARQGLCRTPSSPSETSKRYHATVEK